MKYNKIALVGNPNTGKTSVFNALTGLNQQVGNFAGVTVDKKSGKIKLSDRVIEIVDLPGTYSIYPHSADERVVYDILSNPFHEDYPEAVIVVVDASNLERNFLLFNQVYEIGLPTVLLLNMSDIAYRKGNKIDKEKLHKYYPEATIVESNARIGAGMNRLLEALENGIISRKRNPNSLIAIEDTEGQAEDTKAKYKLIQRILRDVVTDEVLIKKVKKINWLDKLVVHPVWGYALFLLTLLFLFQLIFTIASYPMDLIDSVVGVSANWLKSVMPSGVFTDLLTNGIVPGVGGVLIFIPQITLLFFFLGILEETGYMSRVVFIMDRLMRPFGLNGKSIVPLLSSSACAIPGIMASRSIANWKERLITILVAPLVSCSARIPVYTLLISLVIPPKIVFGFLSLQGLVFFMLYALGIVTALFVSVCLKWIIRSKETSTLLLEIPEFKSPRWKNIGITVWDKVRIFVFDAGKIIVAISIVLWALGSYGPSKRMQSSMDHLKMEKILYHWSQEELDRKVESARFENSYIGIIGKSIEPVIRPLGYDWKIGVSLITSFAAREVFVGSMATIYSVQADNDDTSSLRERMLDATNDKGEKIYTLASGLSLLIFYVYAMQCMATFAVVKRETKSWKWPFIQLFYMGVLAYGSSYIIFQLFS